MGGYKLTTYGNMRGPPHAISMMLTYLGEKFEDNRITPDKSQGNPMFNPHVPALEVDGKTLFTTPAIMMYLGEKHKLVSEDIWERAKAAETMISWIELFPRIASIRSTEDKQKKKEKFDMVVKDVLKPKLKHVDDHIGKSKSGFLCEKVCHGDFALYQALNGAEYMFKVKMSDYKHIQAFKKKMEALPHIKEFIEKNKDVPEAPVPSLADELK